MRLSSVSRLAAPAAAALLLAACGSSSKSSSAPRSTPPTTGASSAAGFNSCSVVTRADAAGALGEPVSRGVLGRASVEGGLACVFSGPTAPKPPNPDTPQRDTVRLVVVKGADAVAFYRDYESRVAAQPVAGIGDRAFYDGYASLNVLKGPVYVRMAVITPTGASLADAKKLAETVLPRLSAG